MITAETLKTLTSFTPYALDQARNRSGRPMLGFKTARFLGMTNGGQFCYSVTWDDIDLGEQREKVFLTYDPTADKVSFGN
jgi:hypothetical protein